MALHLDTIRICVLNGQFDYSCTQKDMSGMHLSVVPRKLKVVSLLGNKFTRKRESNVSRTGSLCLMENKFFKMFFKLHDAFGL